MFWQTAADTHPALMIMYAAIFNEFAGLYKLIFNKAPLLPSILLFGSFTVAGYFFSLPLGFDARISNINNDVSRAAATAGVTALGSLTLPAALLLLLGLTRCTKSNESQLGYESIGDTYNSNIEHSNLGFCLIANVLQYISGRYQRRSDVRLGVLATR